VAPPRALRWAALAASATLALALLSLLGAAASCHVAARQPAAAYAPFKVLVFAKTTGYRHASIPTGIQAIKDLGAANKFSVDVTEDDSRFTDSNLARYATVVFLSTTGDPVGTQAEKNAFQRYIGHGGGFVGVHAAADSGYNWAWYGRLVGAYFTQHPAIQPALLKVEDLVHPATQGLPRSFALADEWYDFQTDPRGSVHVLTSVHDNSYRGSTMGADHPTTWCHGYDGGRAFYTALGHTTDSYREANFLHLLLGGILSTAGAVPADCSVSAPPAVSLTANADGTYVTAENAGTWLLVANHTAIDPWKDVDVVTG
jgi:cytochrome c